jgi:hypothetical protein
MKYRILSFFMIALILTGCTYNNDSNKLEKIHSAIKETYGKNYIPSRSLDENFLSDVVGVKKEYIENYIAEGPMTSSCVDTFIGIKAKKGKAGEVENALKTYRNSLIKNTNLYPMNTAKLQASQVLVHKDYIFFIVLGEFEEQTEQTDKDILLALATIQIEKGTQAIKKVFSD